MNAVRARDVRVNNDDGSYLYLHGLHGVRIKDDKRFRFDVTLSTVYRRNRTDRDNGSDTVV
jgi:hypothetical protein